MNFNTHFELRNAHALFPPSTPTWLNYDKSKLKERYASLQAAEYGTEIHAHAANCIKYKTKLAQIHQTLNMYVNDCIGFGMSPEVILKYSNNFFGTADAIIFDEKDHVLRIHDLKTGIGKTHIEQLEIYAALFYLEYGFKPADCYTELRIYQNNDIFTEIPTGEQITYVMDRIVTFDKWINKWKET